MGCQEEIHCSSNEESGGGAGRTGYLPDKTRKEVVREENTKEAIRRLGPDRNRIWSYPGGELERQADQEESKGIWNRF
jgi:hypothetical protein